MLRQVSGRVGLPLVPEQARAVGPTLPESPLKVPAWEPGLPQSRV